MLVTNQLQTSPAGGRELLCKLNHDALHETYGDRLVILELPRQSPRGVKSIMSAFNGHIDGVTGASIQCALQAIERERICKVFVDGSNLGEFVRAVKRSFPTTEVVTFFHNVEARFFLGSLNQTRSLRALAVLAVNYLAERKSVHFSDKIICLSERDSLLLRRLYGRGATHVSAIAVQDKLPAVHDFTLHPPKEKYALFVGGVFYANRAGIEWFVKQVVPYIQIKTFIVGRGFEDLKHELEREGKVEVVGAVDSLSEWYMNAHLVIAPIFDGSGMKTKVAEALMYGKRVIGTPEAFSGYDEVIPAAGVVCRTSEEFVAALQHSLDTPFCPMDGQLRALYDQNYSYTAACRRLKQILAS